MFLNYALMIRQDYDLTSSLRRGTLQLRGNALHCGHPYSDQDVEEQVEMIQCCICEDWFHEENLGHESTNEIRKTNLCMNTLQLLPKKKDVVSIPSASGSSSELKDGTSKISDADPAAVPDGDSKSPHDDKDVVLGENSVTCLFEPFFKLIYK
nr:hypothetical protein [Tanacetum cinerariifolium]